MDPHDETDAAPGRMEFLQEDGKQIEEGYAQKEKEISQQSQGKIACPERTFQQVSLFPGGAVASPAGGPKP
jgi:hypothetical protein